MNSLLRTLLAALAVTFLLVAGCKQTVESQSKAWTSNVTKVKGLMAKYPGMKPALESRLASATQEKDAADALSGEAQLEKLQTANGALMKGFVRDLDGLEASMKKLREARVEITSKATDVSGRMGAQTAATDAQGAMDRAQATLKQGAANEADATAVLAKITADLKTAQAALDKVAKIDGDKKAGAKADKAAAAKADADAKAAVADWTCEYCKSVNKHEHKECQSCAAPRGGKKPDAAAKK